MLSFMRSAFCKKRREGPEPTSKPSSSKYRKHSKRKASSLAGTDRQARKSPRRLELEAQLKRIAPSPVSYYDRWTDAELEERIEALWTSELPASLQRASVKSEEDKDWVRKHAGRFGWLDTHQRDRQHSCAKPEVDPITLLPLEEPVFEFSISDSATVRYNVSSICEYLLLTGNFVEPTSRKAFTIDDVRRLDQLAQKCALKLPSSVEAAFKTPEKFQSKAQSQVMLDGLDRCVGEVVSEIMSCIECCRCIEDGQIFLLGLMAQFDFLFAQLKHADRSFAAQCLDQYRSVLCGPPNKPTVDNCGLLTVALDMLASQHGNP